MEPIDLNWNSSSSSSSSNEDSNDEHAHAGSNKRIKYDREAQRESTLVRACDLHQAEPHRCSSPPDITDLVPLQRDPGRSRSIPPRTGHVDRVQPHPRHSAMTLCRHHEQHRRWHSNNPSKTTELLTGEDGISHMCYDNFFVAVSSGRFVQIFDLDFDDRCKPMVIDRKLGEMAEGRAMGGEVTGLCMMGRDGNIVASSLDGTYCVIRFDQRYNHFRSVVSTTLPEQSPWSGRDRQNRLWSITCLSEFDLDTKVLFGLHSGTVMEWDLNRQRRIRDYIASDIESDTGNVICLASDGAGTIFATACRDNALSVFDSRTRSPQPVIKCLRDPNYPELVESVVRCMHMRLDAGILLVGDDAGMIKSWDMRQASRLQNTSNPETGTFRNRPLMSHGHGQRKTTVTCLKIDYALRKMVSSGTDGLVCVHRMDHNLALTKLYDIRFDSVVKCLQFDDDKLFVGTGDGRLIRMDYK